MFASDGVENPEGVVDGVYREFDVAAAFGAPTEDAPEWVAFEVGQGAQRLFLGWGDVTAGTYRRNAGVSQIVFNDISDAADAPDS